MVAARDFKEVVMNIEIASNGKFSIYENAYRCWLVEGKFEFRFVENDEPRIMGYDIDKCDSITIDDRDFKDSDWTFDKRFSDVKEVI